MINMILGRKIGMTQVWDEDDNVVPVTVIQAGPCTVSQVKTEATDGYNAVQIGFGDIKSKHVNKPMAGHFAKAGVEPVRYLREVRVENGEEHKVGDVVTANQPVMILEAMKMENEVVAEQAGTIASINVEKGAMVNPGDTLFTLA